METMLGILSHVRAEMGYVFELLSGFQFGIAGGAVVRAVYRSFHKKDFNDVLCQSSTYPYYQDIDIYPDGKEEFKKIKAFMDEKFSPAKDNPGHVRYSTKENDFDLIFVGGEKAQTVLRSFDLLHCAIMIKSEKAYFLEGAIQSVQDKEIIVNSFKRFGSIMPRIIKYVKRGFGFPISSISSLEGLMNKKSMLDKSCPGMDENYNYYTLGELSEGLKVPASVQPEQRTIREYIFPSSLQHSEPSAERYEKNYRFIDV